MFFRFSCEKGQTWGGGVEGGGETYLLRAFMEERSERVKKKIKKNKNNNTNKQKIEMAFFFFFLATKEKWYDTYIPPL